MQLWLSAHRHPMVWATLRMISHPLRIAQHKELNHVTYLDLVMHGKSYLTVTRASYLLAKVMRANLEVSRRGRALAMENHSTSLVVSLHGSLRKVLGTDATMIYSRGRFHWISQQVLQSLVDKGLSRLDSSSILSSPLPIGLCAVECSDCPRLRATRRG